MNVPASQGCKLLSWEEGVAGWEDGDKRMHQARVSCKPFDLAVTKANPLPDQFMPSRCRGSIASPRHLTGPGNGPRRSMPDRHPSSERPNIEYQTRFLTPSHNIHTDKENRTEMIMEGTIEIPQEISSLSKNHLNIIKHSNSMTRVFCMPRSYYRRQCRRSWHSIR